MSMKEALEQHLNKKIWIIMTGMSQPCIGSVKEICNDWFVMETTNGFQYFDMTKTITFWEDK